MNQYELGQGGMLVIWTKYQCVGKSNEHHYPLIEYFLVAYPFSVSTFTSYTALTSV